MSSKLSQWMQQAIDGHHVEFIPYDSFTDRKEIARGAYGEVAKAYWSTAEKTIALKSLFDNPESENDKDFDAFIKEFKLIRSVHYHDNVIRVFGISQDPTTSRYFMVLQYADGGSLRDYLQKNFQNLDWKKKISMGKQIASGLKCIHDQNIVHRDLLYELAWSQRPEDRPDINTVRTKLEEMLGDGRQNDNSVGSISNSMKNTLSLTASQSPSFNQQNNNANKRLSHNQMPQPYQPGGFNPNLGFNDGNLIRSNSDPNLLQNYAPQQIYQPMVPYANNNNNHVIRRPLPPQPPQYVRNDANMNQGMIPVQQQFTNNVANANYPSGMNNHFQQPIYPTVNAGQSQTYHNANQNLVSTNFNNNQQQFAPVAYTPTNMNTQPMVNMPTINASTQAYQQSVPNTAYPNKNITSNLNQQVLGNNFNQQYPGSNVNQQALGASFNQQVPGSNQQVLGNNQQVPGSNQQVPVNNYNQQVLGSNFNQKIPVNQQVMGNNANQVPRNQQAPINYHMDNRQYQQGVQQSGLPNKMPAGCNQILEKYSIQCKLKKPTECHAGYHAGFGDIEGLEYHLSCGESITSTYEFKNTTDLLYIIVAKYCDNIVMVEKIFKLLKYHNGQSNDSSKLPNFSWVSAKCDRTALHWLYGNIDLISDIDISKDNKKPDDVSEGKKKLNEFHDHFAKVIEFLVKNGCDINAKDENGRTVLELYLSKRMFQAGFTKVIEVLLKNGADPNINVTIRTTNLNRRSSSKIDIPHKTSNHGSSSNLGAAEGCVILPNMLFLAIWNRWPIKVLNLLKENGVDVDKEYENLGDLGNLLKMCLQKSKSGRQVSYTDGLQWVLDNVPKVCGKENLEAAKKLTEKNNYEHTESTSELDRFPREEFSFLPQVVQILDKVSSGKNEIEIRNMTKKLKEKFQRCHQILQELPGADLSREEQEELLRTEKELLEQK
ncbi:3749_t:CDS:2, partial [Dentiscutata erythropus]